MPYRVGLQPRLLSVEEKPAAATAKPKSPIDTYSWSDGKTNVKYAHRGDSVLVAC